MGIVVSLVARSSSKKRSNVNNESISTILEKYSKTELPPSLHVQFFPTECRKEENKARKASFTRRKKERDFFIYLTEEFDL